MDGGEAGMPFDHSARACIVLGLVAMSGIALGPVTAGATTPVQENSSFAGPGDDYPDKCENAPIVNSTGIVTGTIDSPEDRDAIKVTIPKKGDYISVSTVLPAAETEFRVEFVSPSHSLYNVTDELGYTGDHSLYHPRNYHGNGSWEIWSETTNEALTVCLGITESENEGSTNVPYEYALRMEAESPEPVTIAEELERLRQVVAEKNETIARLRNQSTRSPNATERAG